MLIAVIKIKKIFPIDKRYAFSYFLHPSLGTLLEYRSSCILFRGTR